jgi:hypothetical protein
MIVPILTPVIDLMFSEILNNSVAAMMKLTE